MTGMCLADGRSCVMGKCLCVSFDSCQLSFDWHQLICADAKLLLVMGMDNN